VEILPGTPEPQGATWDGEAVNFALFSAHATRVELCLFDAPGAPRESARVVLPERSGDVWHGRFPSLRPGYRGWQWAVTLTRAPRSKHVTVCETVLLPGPDALLAPGWLPWEERLRPGDLGIGDLLPTAPDDDRLIPGYLMSDDPVVDDESWELGLGRPRMMSKEGRAETAQRWYDGDQGPSAPISEAAPRHARCISCGFLLMMGGSLRQMFGVCGNMYAPDDGRVVSLDHGCGAHSEIVVDTTSTVEALPTAFDDGAVEEV